MGTSRGSYRDRHGRGLRRGLLAGKFRFGAAVTKDFRDEVERAVDYLKYHFPSKFSKLQYQIRDHGPITPEGEVLRSNFDAKTFSIVLYRLPIERMGHSRRPDADHERMHIEYAVFEAAAGLVDVDVAWLLENSERDD